MAGTSDFYLQYSAKIANIFLILYDLTKNRMIHIEYFAFNSFQERCSVVWDKDGFCAFTDPGAASDAEIASLTGFVASKQLKPVCILLTHAHFDHIYGVAALMKEYGIPVYMHERERFTLEQANPVLCKAFGLPLPADFVQSPTSCADGGSSVRYVSQGSIVPVGSLRFEVLETPGHTAGGVCYLERTEKTLFSGDTLFAGAIGRTDQPGGDYDALMKGIFGQLMVLDGDIAVYPGHGPETDIATERMTNPFLMPFNEPYEE